VAKTLNLPDYGVELGNTASLVVLDVRDRYNAIRQRSQPLHVISQGVKL
jgi:cytosine/creatinine deaminase